MTVHARPPHTQVVGVCSWTHHFEDVDFDCDSPCAVGSDECDGTDHPHHAPLDVSPPVARVEDAGSRPLVATVGDEGAVSGTHSEPVALSGHLSPPTEKVEKA